jgi:hypothetical protein
MLTLLFAAQIVATDSVYRSAALREVIAEASRLNRTVPAALHGYRANVESEIAIVARRANGVEGVFSVEQVRNDVRWDRTGEFEQRVVGYRSQAVGLNLSALGFIRNAWTIPILYGNRINLLFGRVSSRSRPGRRTATRLVAIHPLAEDRDRVYRFAGGDTVVTMRVNGRTIPIVRVSVEPRDDLPPRTVVFRGELDIDITRHQLVRMRGHFVSTLPPRSFAERVFTLGGFEGVAFIELENAEFEGRYWLPVYQRLEAQASWTSASDARSILRIVSRFRDHMVLEGREELGGTTVAEGDTLTVRQYRLTIAPSDSVTGFSAWQTDLGTATSTVHADDFDDMAPDIWRQTGAPRLAFRVQRLMNAVHFNKVEGLYTGWGLEWRLRDAAPGLVVRGHGGWAWGEETARGQVGAEWRRDAWTYAVRAGRALDQTNDFRSAFDSGTTLGALLFGLDNYDYLDRRSLAFGVARQFGRGRSTIVRLETGPAQDGVVSPHATRGLFRGDSSMRENRGVHAGDYWRTWAAVEWNPDVNAELMGTGIGGLLSAEHARGDLSYTRIEGRLMARQNRGSFTIAGRADAGILLGSDPPPQQLFEIGAGQNLPGYDYKEFAGTDAIIVRTLGMYRLPLLRAPLRVNRWILPSPSPALAVGLQGAWTEVRSAGGERALRALGVRAVTAGPPAGSVTVPVARPTDGLRTSISGGLRFFGGSLGVSLARPLDRKASWKVVFDFAQLL